MEINIIKSKIDTKHLDEILCNERYDTQRKKPIQLTMSKATAQSIGKEYPTNIDVILDQNNTDYAGTYVGRKVYINNNIPFGVVDVR